MAETIPASAIARASVTEAVEAIFEPIKEVFWDELVKNLARLGKLYLADKTSVLEHLMEGTLAVLQRAKPSGEWGYSPEGFVNVWRTFVTGSLALAIIIGDEMAEEFFAEMIQEGTSNAIQTSFGGYFQTMLNVIRGGSPINPDDIRDAYTLSNVLDEKIIALNVASGGCNLYASMHYMLAGGLESIDRSMIAGVNQIQQLSLRLMEHGMFIYEYLIDMLRRKITDKINRALESFDYYMQLLVDSIETAISRINDYINEIDTLIADYENGRIDEETLNGNLDSIEHAFNKLKESMDKQLEQIDRSINSITIDIPEDDINRYFNVLKEYANKFGTVIDVLNNKYIEQLNNLIKFVKNMCDYLYAYRTYYPAGWTQTPPPPYEEKPVEQYAKLTVVVYEKEQ